jgi:glycosyltransferase involved in cell wall biosynthesis
MVKMASKSKNNRIAFVSTMGGYPWGGSEELWSRAALDLRAQGFAVSSSIREWPTLHPRVRDLQMHGVDLYQRPDVYSLHLHPWRRMAARRCGPRVLEVKRLISAHHPVLIVFSHAGALPPIELLELCTAHEVPFVTIGQANGDSDWHSDDVAARYRVTLPAALRCFFVSRANLRLAETQIGASLPNAEVICNPVNVSYDAKPPWPSVRPDDEIRFACVGRLHPPTKGQDILLEALAAQLWKARRWQLFVYGEGPMRQVLERLSERFGLGNRVIFAGYAPVEETWAANHVLVMPSRHEGLPLAMVEAMLCARPVIATDVAGHAEVVEDGVTGFLAEAPTSRAMASALERFWARRDELEKMGKAGANRIREMIPRDPVRVFSDKLIRLTDLPAGQ